jgi:hypothetical protein
MTAWYAFDKYYSKTDETSVYAAAMILHPSRRKQYIKQNWDKKYHKLSFDAVKELWLESYKDKVATSQSYSGPTQEPDQYDLFARDLDVTINPLSEDEYESFANGTPISVTGSALNWWLESAQRKQYPALSQMAIDILSIPVMSSEPE